MVITPGRCLLPGIEHAGLICGEGNVLYIDGYNDVSYANIH